MMMMVAEELPRENMTARSQVRDDGQAGASRARGDQRLQEAGFFAGRYILPTRPRLVCCLALVSLRCRSRVEAAHLFCGRAVHP
jgi:hypothetical protein